MTKQALLEIATKCECCEANPAITLKGGVLNGEHGLFLLCGACIPLLENKRKTERSDEQV